MPFDKLTSSKRDARLFGRCPFAPTHFIFNIVGSVHAWHMLYRLPLRIEMCIEKDSGLYRMRF